MKDILEGVSQTQPEVSKLINDVFGESDDESDDSFNLRESKEIITNSTQVADAVNKPGETIAEDSDDDIFASDDDEDLLSSNQKRSRLSKNSLNDKLLTSKDSASAKKDSAKKKTFNNKKNNNIDRVDKAKNGTNIDVNEETKNTKLVEKNLFENDSEDEYDSGEDIKKTVEDENFIDAEDDNADIMEEYNQENQNFDDDREYKKRSGYSSKSADAHSSDVEVDNPLEAALRSMKRKRSEDLSEQHKIELAQDLLFKMERASKEDTELYKQGKPAVNKLNLLKKVQRLACVRSLQMTLLDFDLLGALKSWIEPLDKKGLPGLTVRSAVYELLKKLPCQTDHLKRSGIGKTLVNLRKHDMETEFNKRIIKEIVDKWCRPIFGKSADVRSIDDAERKARMMTHPHAVALASGRNLSNNESLESSSHSATKLTNFDSILSDNVSSSADKYDRVRVPRSSGFTFAIRPESTVSATTARDNEPSGIRVQLMKKMKEMRGQSGKQAFRAMSASLTGRDKS